MVQTKYVATNLTVAEIGDLKKATGKELIKDALQDAVEYRIMHPVGGNHV